MINKIRTARIVVAEVCHNVLEEAQTYSFIDNDEYVVISMEFLEENFLNRKTDACKDLKIIMMQARADKAEFIYLK